MLQYTMRSVKESRVDAFRARLLKIAFESLYGPFAWAYDWVSRTFFRRQWRVWQRLVIPRIIGRDVLEIGCGIGTLLTDMVKAGYRCAAVDRSPQMVAATRDRLRSKGVSAFTPVLEASAQKLPFAAASFDTVVSTFPSKYIYDPDTIAEAARVLRPTGRLIVIEGANILPVGFLQPFLILVQMLVYGPSAVFGPRKKRNLDEEMARNQSTERPEDSILHTNRDTGMGITTDEVPDASRVTPPVPPPSQLRTGSRSRARAAPPPRRPRVE